MRLSQDTTAVSGCKSELLGEKTIFPKATEAFFWQHPSLCNTGRVKQDLFKTLTFPRAKPKDGSSATKPEDVLYSLWGGRSLLGLA